MPPSEPKKASEILIDLEAKINQINSIVNLQNTNIKIILGQINKLVAASRLPNTSSLQKDNEGQPFLLEEASDLTFRHPEAVSVPAGVPIEVASKIIGQSRLSRVPVIPSTESMQTAPSHQEQPLISSENGKNNSPSTPKLNHKKIPVVQRVQNADKKDLFMAEVKIFSGKDQVFKGRTNAMGKYQTLLEPGKYSVSVTKTDQATKQQIQSVQEINITPSDGTLILPNFVVSR